VLPPRLAALSFVDTASGSDTALAERTAGAAPGTRVMLLGASRPGLTRALVAAGLEVVVVDSSRTALRRARDELEGVGDVLLLAADPRELEIPGGVDAVLVPSAPWRAVLLDTDRRHVLRAIAGELRPDGLLLLDLERLPAAPTEWAPLPSGGDGVTWRRDRHAGAVTVRAGDDEVTFAGFAPETAVAEALDEGFDAAGDVETVSTDVVWARLRTTRGRR
jgi:SAM-dependent methyltransferase